MLKRIVIIAMLVISNSAIASDALCDGISKFAESVMSARQNGIAMSKLMIVTKDNELFQQIIIAAYEEPRYTIPSNKARMVEDFRDVWHLACIRANSKLKH